MGKINYKAIYDRNKHGWYDMTEEPQKYEALLAGHYSESNHFIYELLQNAEDERASHVVFEYYPDKLVFYHNGDPFDEEDVRGISSMLMGTKDRNDAQTIGRFGMGFKSVYKYTYQPEIYSDDEAFRIKNYLLPEKLETSWDYQDEKEHLSYYVNGGFTYPFAMSEHLTKIVIPFEKRDVNGEIKKISGKEVLQKMEELPSEILLFLTYIKRLYWINKTSGKYSMITFDTDKKDQHLVTCRIEGNSHENKEVLTRYLKFVKKFDHPEMTGAEVSVAYRVNPRAYNINEMQGTSVWVYFPTRDFNRLPFMIHGSFETAVSREKLMTPSEFNSSLFDEMGNLICDSMLELKNRNLITQNFLRKVLMAAFKDEAESNTIPGLKEKITHLFLQEKLLPDTAGNYCATRELKIAIPFTLADIAEDIRFVAFNNEKESNFTEYFNWLKDDLHVRCYSLEHWAKEQKVKKGRSIELQPSEIKKMEPVYSFLSDYRENLYVTGRTYSRSGSYEQEIRSFIRKAWEELRQAPLIVNAENKLVSAYNGNVPNVYLSSSSEYKSVVKSSIVKPTIARNYHMLLKEGFQIQDFDNFQYVKEKVIEKYINIGDSIAFEDPDDFEQEYVEDLNQIIQLFATTNDSSRVQALLRNAYILKVQNDEGEDSFAKPQDVCAVISDEGINLQIYFQSMPTLEYYTLDVNFFEEHGIEVKKLYQFGVLTSPVHDGIIESKGGSGVEWWLALGSYCPNLKVEGLEENLRFIERDQTSKIAKKKSKEIFTLVLAIRNKLSGTVRHRKSNPYEIEEENAVCKLIKYQYAWLYDENDKIHKINKMSKYDLNTDYYGDVLQDKSIYVSLGFIEKQEDIRADTFGLVDGLSNRDQKLLLRQLAKKFGMELQKAATDTDIVGDENQTFKPESWQSTEFPSSKVRNRESLEEHVRQQFYYADPVTYQDVRRRIRTSRPRELVRAYAIGMYTNNSNARICQMCKKPSIAIDVTEIANYDIELPQLNLCLCSNCSRQYKLLKGIHKDQFRDQMKNAIEELDISGDDDVYEIGLNGASSIRFTQTHVAELQVIFKMLDRYGKPMANEKELEGSQKEIEKDHSNYDVLKKQSEKNQVLTESAKEENHQNEFQGVGEKRKREDSKKEKPVYTKITDVGAKVYFKKYGEGVVTKFEAGWLYIWFNSVGGRKFDYKIVQSKGFITLIQ